MVYVQNQTKSTRQNIEFNRRINRLNYYKKTIHILKTVQTKKYSYDSQNKINFYQKKINNISKLI